MKITFLGTSHGYAEKGRFTSATLIESHGRDYLLDAGGPADALLVNRGKRCADLKGIFITHMHGDHVGSLAAVVESFLAYRSDDYRPVCFLPEKAGLDAFLRWMMALHNDGRAVRDALRFEVTKQGFLYQDEGLTATAIPTNHLEHGKYPAFAYQFEADGRRVLFTGDMSPRFVEYPDIVSDRHYDLIVCEMAHASLSDVADMLKKSDADRMVITHYSAPRIEGYESILPTFPFDVRLAHDGLEVTV